MLILTILGLASIVLIVLVVIVLKMRTPKAKSQAKNMRIEDYVKIARDNSSTKEELENAIITVANSFIFPPKIQNEVPNEAKIYLDFVYQIAYNKNSDAKLIVFMGNRLKKSNPTYTKEIDMYESNGLNKRKNRK